MTPYSVSTTSNRGLRSDDSTAVSTPKPALSISFRDARSAELSGACKKEMWLESMPPSSAWK